MSFVAARGIVSALVEQLHVTLHGTLDETRVTAVYTLRVDDPHDDRPLVFDLSPCPLRLLDAEGIGVTIPRSARGSIPGPLVRIEREPDGTWEHASVALTMQWPARAGSRVPGCLVLPDLFPAPVLSPEQSHRTLPQARIRTYLSDMDEDLVPAGIAASEFEDPRANEDQLQAIVLWPDAKVELENHPNVVFTAAQTRSLSKKSREETASAVGTCLDWLTEHFGFSPWTRVLVATPEELGLSLAVARGAVLTELPSALLDGREMDVRAVVHLSRSLAEIWWAGGCRMVGPLETELRHGITFGVALRILEHRTKRATVDLVIDGACRRSLRHRWYDVRSALTGGIIQSVAVETGAAIYRWLRDDRRAGDQLRALTRELWGMVVPTSEVVRRLRLAGVELPRKLRRLDPGETELT